jgi:hypothetical protein
MQDLAKKFNLHASRIIIWGFRAGRFASSPKPANASRTHAIDSSILTTYCAD